VVTEVGREISLSIGEVLATTGKVPCEKPQKGIDVRAAFYR
jgi:hypothetical protein